MSRVEQSTGVPVVCMESPRGVADPSLGAFAQVLAQADCILLLGKRLDFTLKFARAPSIAPDCAFLQVDPEDDEIARTRRAVGERLLHSAVANVFDAAEAIAKTAASVKSGWRDEVRSAIEFRPAAWDDAASAIAQRLHPVQALRPLQALLDSHPDQFDTLVEILRDAVASWREDDTQLKVVLAGGKAPKGVTKARA